MLVNNKNSFCKLLNTTIKAGNLSIFVIKLLKKPTHWIYILLSIFAVDTINTKIVTHIVNSDFVTTKIYLAKIGFSVLLVSTTLIHLLYIYQSLINIEEGVEHKSFFSRWVGSDNWKTEYFEIFIRWAGMFCLIGAFGKFTNNEIYVSWFTCLVFLVFLFWGWRARCYQVDPGISLISRNNLTISLDQWNKKTWIENKKWYSFAKAKNIDIHNQGWENEWMKWINKKNRTIQEKWKYNLDSYWYCDFYAFLQWLCISIFLGFENHIRFSVASNYAIFFSLFFISAYFYNVIVKRVSLKDGIILTLWIIYFMFAFFYQIINYPIQIINSSELFIIFIVVSFIVVLVYFVFFLLYFKYQLWKSTQKIGTEVRH